MIITGGKYKGRKIQAPDEKITRPTLSKVRQGVFSLSEPMKQLEADMKNKIVIYDNNPVMKWCLANTQAKVDVNGNIQPTKLNSKYKRIDGAVALIIAYAVLNTYKKDYESMIS